METYDKACYASEGYDTDLPSVYCTEDVTTIGQTETAACVAYKGKGKNRGKREGKRGYAVRRGYMTTEERKKRLVRLKMKTKCKRCGKPGQSR